jgi:hypothetical protein
MKSDGLSLQKVIMVAGVVSVLYLLAIMLGLPIQLIFSLLFSALVAIVWMALRILKDPYSTNKTFDEYFYQDREDLRRSGEE